MKSEKHVQSMMRHCQNISASGIMVLCKACDKYLKLLRDDDHNQDSYDAVMMILEFCKEASSILEIMEKFGKESR